MRIFAIPCCAYFVALNEVLIGIPMPMAYNELISFRVGSGVAVEAILSGREYDLQAAVAAGFINNTVDSDKLLEAAIALARRHPQASHQAYIHTKYLLQKSVMDRIERLANDLETIAVISSPDSVQAQKTALKALIEGAG